MNEIETINKWKPLIKSLANKYKNTVASYSDLVAQAHLSILENINKANKEMGNENAFLYTCLVRSIKLYAFANRFPVSIASGNISENKNIECGSANIDDVDSDFYSYEDNSFEEIDIEDFISKYDNGNIGYDYLIKEETLKEIAKKNKISLPTIHREINKIKAELRRAI